MQNRRVDVVDLRRVISVGGFVAEIVARSVRSSSFDAAARQIIEELKRRGVLIQPSGTRSTIQYSI